MKAVHWFTLKEMRSNPMRLPLFLFLLFIGVNAGAQVLPVSPLFTEVALTEAQRPTFSADKARGLELDKNALDQLKLQAPGRMTLDIAFPGKAPAPMRFRKFSVADESLTVGVTRPTGYTEPEVTPTLKTYAMEGEDGWGILILMEDHVLGTWQTGGKVYELNHRGSGIHALFEVEDSMDDRTFHCGVEDAMGMAQQQAESASSSLTACVEVGLEIDQYTYQALGSSVMNTLNWALAILSTVDLVYQTELNALISLEARFVHIWESPDPYIDVVNDGGGLLGAFTSEWNSNPNFNSYALDLRHFLTMRTNIGTGGIAYLNGLCNGYNTGVSGNLSGGSTYNINNYSWNIDVVSHEIGHNCGANHTHWCGWPGGPIDNCGSYEGDCTGYTNNPTGQLGTIMSYCHAISGGSKVLQFHPTVENNALIPTFNGAGCIGACADMETATTNLQCNDPDACNYDPADDNTEGCIYPGDCAECGPDGNVIGGMEVPTVNTSLAGGGSTSVAFDASGTPQSANVTLVFDNASSGSSWPGDMLLALCSPGGDCFEIGGYDISLNYPSTASWPGGWNVTAPGTYTANLNVSSVALTGSGSWTMEVVNGWNSSGIVSYTLDVQWPGLCPLDLNGCTDPAACNYDPDATTDDGTCAYDDALGVCGGDCTADLNGNDICDDEEACGEMACGEGTYFNVSTGLCESLQMLCPGDVDFDGIVTVTDMLNTLGEFGSTCTPPPPAPTSCNTIMCCNGDACGTGTIWDDVQGQCTSNLLACPGDLDYDGIVTVTDVLGVLASFGIDCD